MDLLLSEIFYSIQGEGYSVGFPSVFVRLQGCNLACPWCDTKYASSLNDVNAFSHYNIDNLISTICSYKNHSHVCITGGEPLLQNEALLLLLHKLSSVNTIRSIVIQTNGTLDIEPFFLPKVTIAMDYKTGSSGFTDKMLNKNLIFLREQDEIKFVIADAKDFEASIALLQKYDIHAKIVYSPAYPIMQYDKLAQMILDSGIHCKLSLQLHRVIWPDIYRGV